MNVFDQRLHDSFHPEIQTVVDGDITVQVVETGQILADDSILFEVQVATLGDSINVRGIRYEPICDRILFPPYQSAPGYTPPVLNLDGPMGAKIKEAIRREGREIISALKNHRKQLRDRLLAVQRGFCGTSSQEESFRLLEKEARLQSQLFELA